MSHLTNCNSVFGISISLFFLRHFYFVLTGDQTFCSVYLVTPKIVILYIYGQSIHIFRGPKSPFAVDTKSLKPALEEASFSKIVLCFTSVNSFIRGHKLSIVISVFMQWWLSHTDVKQYTVKLISLMYIYRI